MPTNQLSCTIRAANKQPAAARCALIARLAVAGACALVLLAGLGWIAGEGAAAPQENAPRVVQPAATSWFDFYPAGWVNAAPFSAGVMVNDPAGLASGGAAYRTSIDGGGAWGAWTQAGLSATAATSATVALTVQGLSFPDSQSNNRIQFRISSQLGAILVSPEYTIQVDTVAPGSPLNMQSFPDVWTHVNSFRETWTNPADTSGIAGAYYRIDSEPQSGSDGIFVPNPNQIDEVSAPSEGAHSLLLWLVDQAGNVDHRTYRVDWQAFKYDATPPTVDVTPQGPLGQHGWYTGTVTLTFAPGDLLSGVQSWGWRLDGQLASTALSTVVVTDALHSLALTAADRAGNVMQPVTTTLGIDAGRPTMSHTISLAPTATGWYTAPIAVTLGLTDPVSGPEGVTWRLDNGPLTPGTAVAIPEDGQHVLWAIGRDRAGNRSQALSLSLPVDSRPPVTQLGLTPSAPGPSGFYASSVTGALSASDAVTQPAPGPGSGVVATRMKVNAGPWQAAGPIALTTTGIHRVQYASLDLAGNREITRTRAISIDVTPPSAPLAPTIQPATWSSANQFSVSWQNPFDTSGVVGATLYLGQGPPPVSGGVYYPETSRISGLAAPGEGIWPVWMALRDAAGNNGNFANIGSLRYDATLPQVQAQVTGPTGQAGWYTGSAQVALINSDAGSGPASLSYRLDGGPWQQSSAAQVEVPISAAGKHVIDFLGQDQAGLVGGPFMRTVRIDGDPPGAPVATAVTPVAWTASNVFTATWRNPLDTSGVALAYFSFEPPAHPRDGQSLSALDQVATLAAPAEGVHDLYLWLEDVAGNGSTGHVVRVPEALHYDATPPAIRLQFAPPANAAGWYRSLVAGTIAVDDALSGVASTTWQLDGEPPVASASFVVSGEGEHAVLVQSRDHAGNTSQQAEAIRIDTLAPTARLLTLTGYSVTPQIQVKWEGRDAAPGENEGATESGLASFEVQVRQGSGAWQSWVDNTLQTQATYIAQPGQALAFRVRAIDRAGNASAWATAGGRNSVFVDPIDNGAFGTQNWDGWNTVDGLQMVIIQEQELYPGLTVPAARLGSPLYQACAATGPNMLPTPLCGDTWSGISQTIAVPSLEALAGPALEVWYRIRTYDQITTTSSIWNQLCPTNPPPSSRLVDSFDVKVQPAGAAQPDVLLRDGNRLPQFPVPIEQRDLGWKLATLDMTRYAGRTVTLDFSSHNRLDNRFNTWTDVAGIRLRGSQHKMYLPFTPRQTGADPEPPPVCWPNGAGPGAASPDPDLPMSAPAVDSTQENMR